MIQVGKIFDEINAEMMHRFTGWERDIPHHGERGGLRERRVSDFVRSILPQRYGIGTGHIIDSEGTISKQSDIVIYDALDGIVLPIDNYYSLFPCESVLASIEVKSTLNASQGEEGPSGTIFDCVKNTKKLRSLVRTNQERTLPPIVSVIFAYTTSWKEKQDEQVVDWFEILGTHLSSTLPDLIFVLDPGFVIYPLHGGKVEIKEVETATFFWSSLSQFVSQLVRVLSHAKTVSSDFWWEYQYPKLKGDVAVGKIEYFEQRKLRQSKKG